MLAVQMYYTSIIAVVLRRRDNLFMLLGGFDGCSVNIGYW